jgi:hypothetical protein
VLLLSHTPRCSPNSTLRLIGWSGSSWFDLRHHHQQQPHTQRQQQQQ